MILIPAIDLKDGKCVRLRQGKMEDTTIFSDDPVDVAKKWLDYGAKRLHLVDLNGAFIGKPVNLDAIIQITESMQGIPVQIGGGIRDLETASQYIQAGVKYLIIGTKAVEDKGFIRELCNEFGKSIILGLDAKNGFVATDGWAKITDINVIELARYFEEYKISSIVYTDIAKDGMMGGVNLTLTDKLARNTNIPIIASGGISSMEDIYNLEKLNNPNIIGAITGRAIYEGGLDFMEANSYLCK